MSSSGDTRLHFEGVLEKAGKRFFEGFRKRWFTLDRQDLTYFKAPEKTEENYLGCIDFSQVKAVNPVKMVNNGFQIVTKNRTYTFSAPTPELLTDWMSVLRQAMQLKSIEKRNDRLSSQGSVDSQYEEVMNRPQRSFSADHSFDEDDTTDDLYSSIKEPRGKRVVAPAQGPGEYSLVGAASLPRTVGKGGDAEMYALVGSRPPSKSAPPTYEMVHSVKQSTPGEEGGFYDLVQDVHDVSLTQQEATAPQMQEDADGKQEQASDVPPLYSIVPKGSRKKKPHDRGLSMISEGANEDEEELSPVPTPEEKVPPLPAKPVDEVYAIYEIKRFLEETAKEDGEEEINYEKTNEKDEEDEAFLIRSGSAFQQLKAFLQKLDTTEAE